MSFTKLFELFEGACQYEIHYPAISRDLTAKFAKNAKWKPSSWQTLLPKTKEWQTLHVYDTLHSGGARGHFENLIFS